MKIHTFYVYEPNDAVEKLESSKPDDHNLTKLVLIERNNNTGIFVVVFTTEKV